jgi:hypothetical protein
MFERKEQEDAKYEDLDESIRFLEEFSRQLAIKMERKSKGEFFGLSSDFKRQAASLSIYNMPY